MAESKEQQFADKLFADIESYAQQLGYRFGDGAGGDMKHFARLAGSRAAFAPPEEIAPLMMEFGLNFRRVVDEMIVQSREIPGYPAGIIGEHTLRRALAKLCPIPPFC